MKNKKIVIAGGSGFIGQALARYFGKENQVTILSRQISNWQTNSYHSAAIKNESDDSIRYVKWDAVNLETNWTVTLEGADLLINLTGQSVNCRYTEKNKKRVLDSRIYSTRALGEAIDKCKKPPMVWINSSSATIYQHSLDKPNDEVTGTISKWKKDNMPYSFLDKARFRLKKIYRQLKYGADNPKTKELEFDFSIKVCQLWEKEFFESKTPSTRKIALRMAIALGEGGVLVPLSRLAKWGLGGIQGNGKQRFSWVHIDDLMGIIEWVTEKEEMEGVINVAAPNAVTNTELMQQIRKFNGRHFGLPAPAFLLELGATLIGTETELILKSRWVIPKRLTDTGFTFRYPTLETALNDIFKTKTSI